MPELAFNVIIIDEGDGTWSALCLELEGCVTQGETEHEALENVVDAIKLNVDWLRSEGRPIPSARADRLAGGDIAIPDLIPAEIQSAYPHLDSQMFHSGRRQTVLVA